MRVNSGLECMKWVGCEKRLMNRKADILQILEGTRKCESLPGLIWLGDPKNEEADFAFMAYGNESSIGVFYSFAAIIVDIPPFHIRQKLAFGGSW